MAHSTREQLLITARKLFAERGFYGVSIANIADAHGLSKQALLHHFPSKEKLYDEVLKEISDELERLVANARAMSSDARAQLTEMIRRMLPNNENDAIRTRLLMRELIDNKHRADAAKVWRLKPFLTDLMGMLQTATEWSETPDAQRLAVIYQLLGAVTYYSVSTPTLKGMFGAASAKKLRDVFPIQLDAVIDAALRTPPLTKT